MKTLVSTIIATMAFGTSMAFASLPYSPSPTLNISGSVTYQASPYKNNGTTIKASLKTVSFNTKSLIAMLNASPYVQTTLSHVTGTNQIPAGSYFTWYVEGEDLIITNKNGFSFDLWGYDPVTSGYYDYGYLDIDEDVVIGGNSINANTGAGTEQDQTGIEFEIWDYNGNEIECYGTAALDWKYGVASSSGQQASLSVNLKGLGYYAEVNDNSGLVQGLSANGMGSATVYSIIYNYGEPFWYWY